MFGMMQPATPAQMPGYISCNPSAGGYRPKVMPQGASRKNPPKGARPEESACESEVPAGGICLQQPHPTGYTVTPTGKQQHTVGKHIFLSGSCFSEKQTCTKQCCHCSSNITHNRLKIKATLYIRGNE